MDVNITTRSHSFDHDYPVPSTAASVQEEQLVMRAVEAYRFFYPTVSGEAVLEGIRQLGIADGRGLAVLSVGPRHRIFTACSDTPYVFGNLDFHAMGPIVIDVPAGPYIGLVQDHHQRWIGDVGVSGPDAGQGGRYLVLPPEYPGEIPAGYHVARSSTYKAMLVVRALPRGGDVRAAIDALERLRVHALAKPDAPLPFVDVSDRDVDLTPRRWDGNLELWRRLHAVLQQEPIDGAFRPMYGALAPLGIVKGRPFAPDARQQAILEAAASLADDEMRVEAFASDRSDRLAWTDRAWEWIGLVPDDPNFETRSFLDLEARDRWFYQAIGASPALFRRQEGGVLCWLAARDRAGAYLDGARTYKLIVPQPVPASLFWSVTVYDAKTRSQVVTPHGKAALGSQRDHLEPNAAGDLELYVGPVAPRGKEDRWIQTAPGSGFFLYFRIHGPRGAALDGSWRPGDPIPYELPAQRPTEAASILARYSGDELRARAYYRRAVEAGLWGMALVGYERMAQAMVRDAKGAMNQVLFWSRLGDWKNQLLTPSVDVVYAMPFFTTRNTGPMVLEIPPADGGGSITGTVMDCWQAALEDVGPAGVDRGKGGRYVILAPGHAGPIPDGYVPLPSDTFQGFALLRSIPRGGGAAELARAVAYAKRIRLYPLSQASSPPPTAFVDASGTIFDATIPYDASFYAALHRMIQREPWLDRDAVMIDLLRSIGIVAGKPFDLDARRRALLDGAIAEVRAQLDVRFETVFQPFWPGSQWIVPMPHEHSYDARALTSYSAFSSVKHLGAAQYYLLATRDRLGHPLDGARRYRLTVPAGAPVRQLWSATAYDRATHALIRGAERAGRSSQSPGLQVGADGAVEIFFGPQPPSGREPNWVPTRTDVGFEVMVRFYGPSKALFERAWRLSELEPM